jgi:glycosyltransferase involved in cell wall biosynthesis
MNIISLISYPFLPARSGGQKGIALFYKYFSRYHQITCVGTKKNQPGLADGYELLNILSNSRFRYINPFIFFKVRKLIREKKATHLILEHPYFGWLGIMLKKFCRVKLVVHSHNMEGKRWRTLGKWWWRVLWYYEKWTHRQADYNYFIQDEDKNYAIEAFGLDKKKCLTVSFGTEIPAAPTIENHVRCSMEIRQKFEIPQNTPLLLFNGAFRYTPNRDALENLLYRINPILQSKGVAYDILIIGLDIPQAIVNTSYPGIHILGFVDDLEHYLTGCDVFLNPVRSGGGIKTKLVEALAYNLTTVSTRNGAIGVDPGICNGKLIITADHNWSLFAEAIIRAIELNATVAPEFYENFYWANITRRAADFIIIDY